MDFTFCKKHYGSLKFTFLMLSKVSLKRKKYCKAKEIKSYIVNCNCCQEWANEITVS